MKFFKYLAFIFIGLILLALAVALVLPKMFTAKGIVVINKPPSEVFDYLRKIKSQEEFSSWFQKDTSMEKNYYGTDGEVGSGVKWTSAISGDGEQKVTGLFPNRSINIDLFLNDDKDAAKLRFIIDSLAPNQSKVTQSMEAAIAYPFNLMMLFYKMDADFQKNAEQLKSVLEK